MQPIWIDKWRQERAKYIPSNERQKETEEFFNLKFKEILTSSKGEFFDYTPFRELCKGYFHILVVCGDRNIGKTHSSRHMALNNINKFLIIRNQKNTLISMAHSELEKYLSLKDYKLKNDPLGVNVIDEYKNIVGYYRDINTSGNMKSIDMPKVDYAVYEEFNDVNLPHRYNSLSTLLTTAQRHQPNFLLIMPANNLTPYDDLLVTLGFNIPSNLSKNIFFSYATGAVLFVIPDGYYKVNKDEGSIGYRLSLNDPITFQQQFGGGFEAELPANWVDRNNIIGETPYCDILVGDPARKDRFGSLRLVIYKAWIKDKQILYAEIFPVPSGAPQVSADHVARIAYPQATPITDNLLDWLLHKWIKGTLKVGKMDAHQIIRKLLEKHDRQYIIEIDNIERTS